MAPRPSKLKEKMKYLIIIAVLFALLLPTSAFAKIKFGGVDAQEMHVQTVKGFLYEALYSTAPGVQHFWKPRFVKAILWFDAAHKDKNKIYNVEKFNTTSNEVIIRDAFKSINALAHGRGLVAELSLQRWHALGKKVITGIVENKNGETSWKFDLKSK
jgi:hypothetical protein